MVVAEATEEGVLIRPAVAVEVYSPERKARLLLDNAPTLPTSRGQPRWYARSSGSIPTLWALSRPDAAE